MSVKEQRATTTRDRKDNDQTRTTEPYRYLLGLLTTGAAVSATYLTEDSTESSAYLDARV